MPHPTTERMHLDQIKRASGEKKRAEDAGEESATEAHESRADKADYLREKLAERAKAEDEAAERD